MSLSEIKTAVRELSPKELAELSAFIAKQDSAAWDRQTEADAENGKLDVSFRRSRARVVG
jgi:hypothetical protein